MSAHAATADLVLQRENVTLPEGAGRGVSVALSGLGLILIVLTAIGGFAGGEHGARIALHAYHVGFLITVGLPLTAMGFVMMLHQTNAGWAATVRRQFENVMSLIWVPMLLFVAGILLQLLFLGKGAYLFTWMNGEAVRGDLLYEHKKGFLNIPFFYVRAALYFGVWALLALGLWHFSTRQDEDGDRWLTAKARKLSAPGLVLFAFTTAFAGFDWIMSLDYHWYSTMFGVYFFAGNMVSVLAVGILVLIGLRFFGRLHGAFTADHLHDLSKLLFGFTVFWAYISFSQYFLIWYANIPEEAAWFLHRKQGQWGIMSWIIPIGHFILPFLWLLPRPGRRSMLHVGIACVWILLMHALDLYWAVRPQAAPPAQVGVHWIDFAGVFGPVLLFAGLLIRRIASGPLVPLKDPRLAEALEHRNYV